MAQPQPIFTKYRYRSNRVVTPVVPLVSQDELDRLDEERYRAKGYIIFRDPGPRKYETLQERSDRIDLERARETERSNAIIAQREKEEAILNRRLAWEAEVFLTSEPAWKVQQRHRQAARQAMRDEAKAEREAKKEKQIAAWIKHKSVQKQQKTTTLLAPANRATEIIRQRKRAKQQKVLTEVAQAQARDLARDKLERPYYFRNLALAEKSRKLKLTPEQRQEEEDQEMADILYLFQKDQEMYFQ